MFSPTIDQTELKKRATDIEQLRHRHEDYVKKTNVKIQMLENENRVRIFEGQNLSDLVVRLDERLKRVELIVPILVDYMNTNDRRVLALEGRLDAVINAKLDLASKIADAKKRLENQDIVPKKIKATK